MILFGFLCTNQVSLDMFLALFVFKFVECCFGCRLNEEMIETLFMVNNSSLNPKDNGRKQVLPSLNQENRVLDPKKSQNIAILLRALNVTIDEVCEALLEGKIVIFIKSLKFH